MSFAMSGASPRLEQLLSEIGSDESSCAAGFDCSQEDTDWRLRIWGQLTPTWAANLSLHCYAARIDIIEGEALRFRDSLWAGTFRLRSTPHTANLAGFDFLQMARRRPSIIPQLSQPEILDVSVGQDPKAQSVVLRVVGRDQLGFLAHLFGQISSCGLQSPHISFRTTRDGLAHDWFVLLGSGGAPPTPSALSRIRERLREV